MDKRARDFLYRLLTTPAPSGSEGAIQQVIADHLDDVADTIEADLHGNLILGLNTSAPRKVMLAGHCDQIGFMVVKIDTTGFLLVEPVGGIDAGVVSGSRVVVLTDDGPVEDVFGKNPIHLENQQQQSTVPTVNNMWIDIGGKDRADAERRVAPGDYVTFKPGACELLNDRITAPALDNRAGLFAVLEAFRRCADADLKVALYAVSTVQEEIGSRGASTATSALSPEVGIACDVTFAYDDPATSSQTKAACAIGGGTCISHGPNTSPVVERLLREAADRIGVAYQPSPTGDLEGIDAKAVQESDSGVATATVGIPNRNMHTTAEVCSPSDIDAAGRLMAAFVTAITPDTDFRRFRPSRSRRAARRRRNGSLDAVSLPRPTDDRAAAFPRPRRIAMNAMNAPTRLAGSSGFPSDEAQQHAEGPVARGIEHYTAQMPSDWFLWAAGASIVGSLTLQCLGRKEDAQFVGHWAPTLLILGLYNKVVKVAGSDRISGG